MDRLTGPLARPEGDENREEDQQRGHQGPDVDAGRGTDRIPSREGEKNAAEYDGGSEPREGRNTE